VDTETTGLDFYDEAFCVTVAWYSPDGQLRSHYLGTADCEEAFNVARGMLEDTEQLVFHNSKYDIQKLILAGLMEDEDLRAYRIHDTEALAHLQDEHQRIGLKSLAREILGLETDEEAALGAWFKEHKIKKEDRNYRDLPVDLLMPYAIKDAEYTIMLFRALYPEVAKFPDLLELYELERQLTVTLLRMERNGMGTDQAYLKVKAREYAKAALEQEVLIRELTGNPEFNSNSWQQILKAMAERGYPDLENTEADTLSGLNDELADAIVEVRRIRKIHGTYLLGLIAESQDGIVHPSFRQHGTKTGRMSSGAATE
jgi:DNA polymerase I-like protein with 3'-5' exonuclease and polymerase domains